LNERQHAKVSARNAGSSGGRAITKAALVVLFSGGRNIV